MNLRDEQRHMLGLLKNERPETLATDEQLLDKLKFQKTIIVWWRGFQFEHWLILTSKILKDHKLFEPLVLSLYQNHNISSYPAEAGDQFVKHLNDQPLHPTIKSVAALELALINLKDHHNKSEYQILWNQPPFVFLDAVIKGRDYDLNNSGTAKYEMIVSNQIPGKMIIHEMN